MHERDILLRATQHQREDVPRLLAAIQSNTELFIYLEFAPLGTMWDAMEASQDGRLEAELVACWMRQAGGAIHWLHEIGYAHRSV